MQRNIYHQVEIDTLWNVKVLQGQENWRCVRSRNRYIVECKGSMVEDALTGDPGRNRYIVECKDRTSTGTTRA